MAALRERLDTARAELERDEEEAGGDANKVDRQLLQVHGDIERAQQVAGRIAEEEEAFRAKRDAGLERRRKLDQVDLASVKSKALDFYPSLLFASACRRCALPGIGARRKSCD